MENLAPLVALAGKAFLSPEPQPLLVAVRELELEDLEEALAGDPLDLEREHVRLFYNPSGSLCPPWQSSQGEQAQLFGEAHHSALAWYRAGGVEPNLDNQPADHIGLLLTYFAHMLATGAEPERLERFRREHLDWMPEFLARVEQQARHPFLARLAVYTRELLAG